MKVTIIKSKIYEINGIQIFFSVLEFSLSVIGEPMRRLLVLVIFFMFMMQHVYSSVNCKNESSNNVCVSLNFTSKISRKADSQFLISFSDKAGKSLSLDQNPKIDLWMVMKSGHGHGSEALKIVKIKNKYMVSNVWFLMLGEWKVRTSFSIKSKKFSRELSVCVKRKPSDSFLGKCP